MPKTNSTSGQCSKIWCWSSAVILRQQLYTNWRIQPYMRFYTCDEIFLADAQHISWTAKVYFTLSAVFQLFYCDRSVLRLHVTTQWKIELAPDLVLEDMLIFKIIVRYNPKLRYCFKQNFGVSIKLVFIFLGNDFHVFHNIWLSKQRAAWPRQATHLKLFSLTTVYATSRMPLLNSRTSLESKDVPASTQKIVCL